MQREEQQLLLRVTVTFPRNHKGIILVVLLTAQALRGSEPQAWRSLCSEGALVQWIVSRSARTRRNLRDYSIFEEKQSRVSEESGVRGLGEGLGEVVKKGLSEEVTLERTPEVKAQVT